MTRLQSKWQQFKRALSEFPDNFSMIMRKAREQGFKKTLAIIFRDFFGNRSLLAWLYLIVLSSVPIILECFVHGQHDWLGLVASWTGIVCVIFVSEGRASNYFFGLINTVIYLILALHSHFYGELLVTSYFVIMQPIGLYFWINDRVNRKENHPDDQTEGFEAKRLTLGGWCRYLLFTIAVWLFMGFAYQQIGSRRPFRDSITDGTNVAGQMLMTGIYAEQWVFWLATNLFGIYLWYGSGGNLQIAVMYLVYAINSIVGWVQWLKMAKKD